MSKREPLEKRFWAKVDVRSSDECWEWTAFKDSYGYGRIGSGIDNISIHAHRASWILHYGTIPKDMCICHICDNPGCVNPDHLFIGTYADNTHDMIEKDRGRGLLPLKAMAEIRSLTPMKTEDTRRLAREYHISRIAIRAIASRKNYCILGARDPAYEACYKLTDEEANVIRDSQEKGRMLAARYKVSESMISRIRCGNRRKL